MNASIKTTSWITSVYALVLGVLLITASKLADQFGRKTMLYKKAGYRIFNIISMVAFIGGNYLLSTLTPDVTQKQIIYMLMVLGVALGCGTSLVKV